MENENIVVNEPTEEVVSNEPTPEEFKIPQTKEEFEVAIKSASNKAKTELLKSLGISSVKSFKELQSTVEAKAADYESIINERDDYLNKYNEVVSSYEKLKDERVLDKLNISDDYREDLSKLAKAKVTDELTFEEVLTDMVNGKYKYAVNNQTFKIGTEKTNKIDNPNALDSKTLKAFPYLKPRK